MFQLIEFVTAQLFFNDGIKNVQISDNNAMQDFFIAKTDIPLIYLQDNDEWREFEEEKKDYSGLKIGTLTINEQSDAESDDDRGTGENSSDGELGEGGSKHSGPWKKTDAPEQPEVQQQQTEQEPKKQQAPGSGSGVYKIPAARNAPTTYNSPRLRKSNVAPDINSEEYFPTLNSKQPNNDGALVWGKRQIDFDFLVEMLASFDITNYENCMNVLFQEKGRRNVRGGAQPRRQQIHRVAGAGPEIVPG